MFNKSTRSGLFLKSRKAALLFLTTAVLSLQIACKDDDNKVIPDGQQDDPVAVIPAKDKKFNYKVTESDGSIYNESIRVKSISDSAGIKVSNLETRITDGQDEEIVGWKAYSQNGVTTYEIPLPTALTSLMAQIEEVGTIKDFTITGFPQFQSLENKGTVGSKVTFKGDDIKVKIKLEIEDEEGEKMTVDVESTLSYNNGQATKVESLTTPGGTFNCTKWEYGYSSTTKILYNGQPGEQNNETFAITQWTAPGIGTVKSIEKSADSESVTELQKIE